MRPCHKARREATGQSHLYLPDDARLSSYEENIVQDLIIKRDNVRFRKEVFHSPSLGRTFTAEVPFGYEGEYGPNIKAEIIAMKYVNVMSEPKILAALQSYGVIISPTYISARLSSLVLVISHYQQDHENGIVNILVADDAPQFKLLTAFLGAMLDSRRKALQKTEPDRAAFSRRVEKISR